LTFRDGNLDSVEYLGQQDGGNIACDPTFEEGFSSSEPRSLAQGDINDLARDLSLSRK
jgi:hypothetical protein